MKRSFIRSFFILNFAISSVFFELCSPNEHYVGLGSYTSTVVTPSSALWPFFLFGLNPTQILMDVYKMAGAVARIV